MLPLLLCQPHRFIRQLTSEVKLGGVFFCGLNGVVECCAGPIKKYESLNLSVVFERHC